MADFTGATRRAGRLGFQPRGRRGIVAPAASSERGRQDACSYERQATGAFDAALARASRASAASVASVASVANRCLRVRAVHAEYMQVKHPSGSRCARSKTNWLNAPRHEQTLTGCATSFAELRQRDRPCANTRCTPRSARGQKAKTWNSTWEKLRSRLSHDRLSKSGAV